MKNVQDMPLSAALQEFPCHIVQRIYRILWHSNESNFFYRVAAKSDSNCGS